MSESKHFTNKGMEQLVKEHEQQQLHAKSQQAVAGELERKSLRPSKPAPQGKSMAAKIKSAILPAKPSLEKEALVARRKCVRYKQAFPAELRDIKIPGVTSSPAERIECLEEIRITLGSRDAADTFKDRLSHLAGLLTMLSAQRPELVGHMNLHYPVSLQQLTKSPEFRAEIDTEAKELAIEYDWLFSSSPLVRFGEKFLTQCGHLAAHNTALLQQQSTKDL